LPTRISNSSDAIFESKLIDLDGLFPLLNEIRNQTLAHFGQVEARIKADNSPVTIADEQNHRLLTNRLPMLKNVPVFSEEDYPSFKERSSVDEYWLIDPLDGTKEFINGDPEFSVLIALMQNRRPVFSCVQVPAADEIYVAEVGQGAYRLAEGEFSRLGGSLIPPLVGLESRFSPEPEADQFYKSNAVHDTVTMGSALKFCALAMGRASVYFRHFGPHEWDVAAGDLIVHETGGVMYSWPSRALIRYNQENSRAGSFLALGANSIQLVKA
jgi:3'(2'), 5'-bisphosphate nucleotidase